MTDETTSVEGGGNVVPAPRKSGRPKGSKSKQLTPRQQAEAAALWSTGDVTLEDLAKRYGKTWETFQRLFERKGIKRGSKAAEVVAKAEEAVHREMLSDPSALAAKIKSAKDDSERFYTTVRKLTMHEIITAKKNNVPLGTIVPNLKALELAARIAKSTQEGQFNVLGISTAPVEDENDIPELRIAGLSTEQINDLRSQVQQKDPDDLEGLESDTDEIDPGDDDAIDVDD